MVATSTPAKRLRKPPSLVKAEPVEVKRIASVPPKELADSYVGRSVGKLTDHEIFAACKRKHWNLLLEGDTGTGKTLASLAFAASEGMHFYSTPNNVAIDPGQLFGKWVMNEGGTWDWVDGGVTDVVRYGGLLLLNEVNFLPPRIATAIFGLLDNRRELTLLDHKGEVIKAHEDLLIVADMNPDYLGTTQLNAAFRNRFEVQIEWDYDPTVEKKLVKSKTLLDFANRMRKSRRDGNIITPTSTNMLMEFEEMVTTFGIEFALQNFVQHYNTEDRKAVSEALRNMRTAFDIDFAPKKEAPARGTAKVHAGNQGGNGWEFTDDEDVQNWLNN